MLSTYAVPGEVPASPALNVAMASTYWLSYQRLAAQSPAGRDADAADPARAAYQVLALIAPFTTGPTRALIDHLGARYLAKALR